MTCPRDAANQLAAAHSMITAAPARLMGLGKDYGLKPGARADFVVTDLKMEGVGGLEEYLQTRHVYVSQTNTKEQKFWYQILGL